MLLLQIDRVAKFYGTRPIFEHLSWQIGEGERIGLIGPNGAGKSSLLRVLAGAEPYEAGQVVARKGLKIALLPQDVPATPGSTPLAVVLAARPDLAALEAELAATEAAFADPAALAAADRWDALVERQARLLDTYEAAGGPRLLNDARGLLKRLGFSAAEMDEPLEAMSGGQRKLAYLARCLLSGPDLLLLDEPDNHLDLDGKAFLEAVIRDFSGSTVLISHDRYLLDNTVTQIAELADGRLTLFQGNYSSYVVQKELALARQQTDYVAQQKEIKRLEEAVARFKLWASMVVDERHIKQARNKQRQIDSMDKVERPVLERRKMGLRLRAAQRGGQKVIELRDVSKTFPLNGHGPVTVLRGAAGLVRTGERIGIVGANGAGKSVLFRLILGQEPPTAGEIWIGPSIKLAYYAQEHQTLDMDATPLETLRAVQPMYEQQAVGMLGRFLFSYEQCRRPIRTLSGGEKARVQLARLMLQGANCLLLDEPTNNLDIASAEVLEQALEDYTGAVIVISHDRYFLDHVVDRIWELKDGRLREYLGGWSAYADAC
ncbi:MAG TPA: ABC-F family ATP-binding cassette domain-containing protein [Chloroflexia bacterium]|nr:ABC-F family ATP-binding cassette domain-containing protein [Chloroflexia bacterium]